MFSTGLDAEITHDEGDNTEDNVTPLTDTFDSEGSTHSYTYTPYDPLHSQVVEQIQMETAHEEASSAVPITPRHIHNHLSPTLPFAWWCDLDINNEMYQEWTCDDPDKVANWENDCTTSTAMAYAPSMTTLHTSYRAALMLPPTSTPKPHHPRYNDSHNTELYAITNVTPAYDDATAFTVVTTHDSAPLCAATHIHSNAAIASRFPYQDTQPQVTPNMTYHPPHVRCSATQECLQPYIPPHGLTPPCPPSHPHPCPLQHPWTPCKPNPRQYSHAPTNPTSPWRNTPPHLDDPCPPTWSPTCSYVPPYPRQHPQPPPSLHTSPHPCDAATPTSPMHDVPLHLQPRGPQVYLTQAQWSPEGPYHPTHSRCSTAHTHMRPQDQLDCHAPAHLHPQHPEQHPQVPHQTPPTRSRARPCSRCPCQP
ncbi:hypothetical protein K439DRAFT_856668 [Ramaria rubella]|nr:hypothetical protein K439DRAFT_856668 [Ramaria rubella]